MAITLPTGPTQQILVLEAQDFRGQEKIERLALKAAATDADISAIIQDYDNLSNAKLVKAYVETIRAASGMKSTALNALERNISEIMSLNYIAVKTNGKKTNRSVIVYAMKAAIELVDGTPDVTNTDLIDLNAKLAANLSFLDSTGSLATGYAFDAGGSHHGTFEDVVDTK